MIPNQVEDRPGVARSPEESAYQREIPALWPGIESLFPGKWNATRKLELIRATACYLEIPALRPGIESLFPSNRRATRKLELIRTTACRLEIPALRPGMKSLFPDKCKELIRTTACYLEIPAGSSAGNREPLSGQVQRDPETRTYKDYRLLSRDPGWFFGRKEETRRERWDTLPTPLLDKNNFFIIFIVDF
ncbi:hypothetical protein ID47_06830 [Candidatus Paracaedibacter acanthamoebae]|uniref:Uncharacterized protein n=1 Tax=Candidatus Odyssella acanthamoebae TaxID=91604 RepID=A0A077AY03_9PROT|nr:hypothetical protein ID47_06830 [Candidatus Paracaedibacter acanthamoebae]